MIRLLPLLIIAAFAGPVQAEIVPMPGIESPRIQTVAWEPGERVLLTALPQTSLTVILEPGEKIQRATLGGNRAWDVAISAEEDSFQITPLSSAAPAFLTIETDLRSYEFGLEVGTGLLAAYVVRFDFAAAAPSRETPIEQVTAIENLNWSYRLRGDRSVRPASIRDNGDKTVIEYAAGQPLPAVFAIGPSGDEEVVDGYMRGDRFVIDRVHERLVFRIDKEKATARRNEREDDAS
ncbi:MAG: TrbG/VirB9 family P-type conjugative transfer protein [Erythrobacter sp.]